MKYRIAVVCALLTVPLIATGQAPTPAAPVKFSGVSQCPAKPAVEHALPVGDNPDHVLVVTQNKCPWSKPGIIAGIELKEDHLTETMDVNGSRVRGRGYSIAHMANGDKIFVRFEGNAKMKGQALQTAEGTWTFYGGTGKFKGIKGKGTYKCTGSGGENVPCDIQGEYQMPTAPTTSPSKN